MTKLRVRYDWRTGRLVPADASVAQLIDEGLALTRESRISPARLAATEEFLSRLDQAEIGAYVKDALEVASWAGEPMDVLTSGLSDLDDAVRYGTDGSWEDAVNLSASASMSLVAALFGASIYSCDRAELVRALAVADRFHEKAALCVEAGVRPTRWYLFVSRLRDALRSARAEWEASS